MQAAPAAPTEQAAPALRRELGVFGATMMILTLLTFVASGATTAVQQGRGNLADLSGTGAATAFWPALLQATALMFVAFTGYGRIATLGEEVHHPRVTIPRAIVLTLWASAILFVAVAVVAIASVGASTLGTVAKSQPAPLEITARQFPVPGVHVIVAVGAMTAMLGVLLNLILGLSRILLAMGRRGDMPSAAARLNAAHTTPTVAVVVVGVVIGALVLIGNVKTTWSFSAFTVLIYYAITNLAALFLPADQRLYGRWLAWAGLVACLFLAFWVEWKVWAVGLGLLLIGIVWHRLARRLAKSGAIVTE